MIRNDCSMGYNHIPATFIKPVSEFLVSPITFIINNFIKINQFPDIWKLARISPIDYQWNLKTSCPYPFCENYQRHTEVFLEQITNFNEKKQYITIVNLVIERIISL